MKRFFLLQAAIAAILALGLIVVSGRLVRLAGPPAWDVGGRDPSTVPAGLSRLLGSLAEGPQGVLDATLFASKRSRMPSHLQDVEQTTRALLAAMEDAAGGAFRYRVIDPDDSGEAGARYAATRGVSPIRVRQVVDDAESQIEIWSSLVLSRRGYPRRNDILIQGIENAHLPHLAALVAAHLQGTAPQASFAVSAPPGFGEMPRYLSQYGPVLEVDVDATATMPPDVDILFWIEPQHVTQRHIQSLRRFLASGRTVVLAGSPYHVRYEMAGDDVRFRAELAGDAWSSLLEPFGLRPLPDLVMDRNSAPVPTRIDGSLRDVAAPFHLRNLPAFRDFRPFRTPARGALSFVAAGPLQIDPQRVAAAGYEAHVAATTSERAWVQALPLGAFGIQDLPAELNAPKQNLMVLLSPRDPWAGQLLVLAASSPFRDGIVSQAGFGHTVFLADLARSFADPEQLLRQQVERHIPPALPALSGTARIGWRIAVVALVPALWLLLAMRRVVADADLRWRRLVPTPGQQAWLAFVVPGVALLLWLALHNSLAGIRLDATVARLHTPSPQLISELHEATGLRAELILSAPSRLSAEVRAVAHRVMDVLDAGGIPLRVQQLADEDDASAEGADVAAFEITSVRSDTAVTTRIRSALRLIQGDRAAIIPRLDGNTGQHLDFLLAAALRNLSYGGAPVLAVVSDLPRLSPAEALEDYQKKSLSAPQGVDVYSHAKSLLADYGYDVRHVAPRDPVLPANADAVLWFQPRRDSTPVLTQLSQHLGNGGRAVVALQHFNIQQRQYRGTGFETVHWPQPQFQDFDRYLRLVGAEQVREVLFDRTRHHLEIDTQVNRSAVREYDAQQVALPFLIRAVAANFSSTSPMTRNLGDLLFIWGNRFRFDPASLGAADMTAEVLVTTTANAWAYDWSGGWLPPEVLDESANVALVGPQALVLTLSGRFPVVDAVHSDDGGTQLVPRDGTGKPGSLTLVGSSEMFKDSYLQSPGFAHDQLLLNTVANAVYGPALASLQGRHGAAIRGFAVVGPTVRSIWRFAVIGGGPCLLGLVALWARRRRQQQGARR